ncbi:MAG: hypothetical protein IKK84_03550 [Clostridia bacterium]|nr:hypothetical protein [Clostridia bacterium]
MKRTSKILSLFIAIFSILVLAGTNSVFAIADHHYSWRKDVNGDGKPDLVFRKYTTATPKQIEEYVKEKASSYVTSEDGSTIYGFTYKSVVYPSKWVEPDSNGIHKPSAKEFQTIGYSFHAAQQGVYPLATEGTAAATMISHDDYGVVIPISNTITNALNYFNHVSSKIVKPQLLGDDEVLESIPSLIYEVYSNKGAIKQVPFGTKWNISTVQPQNRLVYRYAIVEAYRGEAGTLDTEYFYIEERVIYHDDLLKLREALKEKGFSEEQTSLYISDIVISGAQYDDGGYELARTAAEFFSQYQKRGYSREFWPTDVVGTAEDATRAALNAFDNAITIPRKSKRNVYIRHISIGENTAVTASTLRNATFLDAINPEMQIKDDFNGEYTTIYPNEILDGKFEIYEGNIDIYQYMKKVANEYPGTEKHVAIGYNAAAGNSIAEAVNNVNYTSAYGRVYDGSTVEIDGLIAESEAEWVVIDFYYTKKPEIVYVNHLFVDVNNKVLPAAKQNIKANNTAFMGALFTDPISAIKPPFDSMGDNESVISYIQERYYRQSGKTILVRTSLDLLDERFTLKYIWEGVKYIGYQKYNSYVTLESLYGRTVSPRKDWYKPFDTILGVLIEPGTKQVNFYYYNKDKQEAAIPDKFISMKYYFKSNTTDEGNCYNEEGNEVLSVPSGVKAKAGLTELSKVMASAINLEYIDKKNNKHDVDITLNYACGNEKTTINIDNVKYSFSYFRVDELVVDTLQKVTVFDASEKWASTNGTPIFNWSNDKKEYNFNTSNPSISAKAIKTIDTSDYDNITNWKNYATVKIEDNKGNVSSENPTDVSLSHTFLTSTQMARVDANGDGKVNAKDKQKAQKDVDDAAKTLANLEKVHEYTLRKLEDKKQQYEAAVADYENALNQSSVLAAAITWATNARNEAQNALNNARNGVTTQNNIIATQNSNIRTYNTNISNRESWIYTATYTTIPNLQNQKATQESELEALKAAKQQYIDERSPWYTTKANYESQKSTEESIRSGYVSNRTALNTAIAAAERAVGTANSNIAKHCVDNGDEALCSGAREALEEANTALATANSNYQANEALISAQDTKISNLATNISNAQTTINTYTSLINTKTTQIANKEDDIEETIDDIADTRADITRWNNEIATNRSNITKAQNAIKAAQAERARLNSLIPGLTRELNTAEARLDLANKEFNLFKEANVVVKLAWKELCEVEYNHRKKSAEKALNAINSAQAKLTKAQNYQNTLERYYDSYKAQYDIFASIKDKKALTSDLSILVSTKEKKEVANTMGIKITFKVSNMHIKIGGENLNDPNRLTATKKLDLATAIDQTTELETPEPLFYQKAYNGIGTKVTAADYSEAGIAKTVPNGVRTISAEAKYKTSVLIKKDTLLYDSTVKSVVDDVYYSNFIDKKQELTDGEFKLDYDGLITQTARKVNIYTPISASATLKSDSYQLVDQSNITSSSVQIIQLGVPFTVTFGNKVEGTIKPYSSLTDAKKYAAGYYIKFDFDVTTASVYRNGVERGWVTSTGSISTNLSNKKKDVIKAGTWIGPITSGTSSTQIKATVYSDVTDDTINAAEESRSYTVRAYAYNATNLVDAYGRSLSGYYGNKYDLLVDMLQNRATVKATVKNICTDKITTGAETDMPSYFADRKYELVVLNKLYDFRVTDLKDVSWKNVFRENKSAVVNAHTGDLYYSGIRKWVYSNLDPTKTVARTTAELGKDPVRTLPLGPYKNTDKTYVKAPKLGYSFSYDMKVTGAYYDADGKPLTNKYVDINTKFYFISKDGKTFLQEGKGGIYLFYKNAAGKYVRIDETNGGGYELKFTPNDPYRYITDKEKITLSKDEEKLGNLRKIRLTHEMATVYQSYDTANTANNGTIITYYGEYKLPNSTIAVAVDANGNYDINKPLKNGYIGVIFDITAKAGTYGKNSTPISLSYGAATKTYSEINANRKGADLLKTIDVANTSQWDYEGYLGFKNFGYTATFTAATSIRLEDGQWSLSNDLYKKIKGTVILYDADDRAATDYE